VLEVLSEPRCGALKKNTRTNLPMQQVGRCAFPCDQRQVLLQGVRVEEVHVVLQVRFRIIGRQGVVEAPVEVVRLPALALHHKRVLAQVLVHRRRAAFLFVCAVEGASVS
jgi:hypothetical protein